MPKGMGWHMPLTGLCPPRSIDERRGDDILRIQYTEVPHPDRESARPNHMDYHVCGVPACPRNQWKLLFDRESVVKTTIS